MRYFFLVLVHFLCLFALSCQKKTSNTHAQWSQKIPQIKVLSTTPMIDDLVGAIGKHHVMHRSLISGDLDPHSYELVKGDNDKIHFADIIFYNGLDLEHGASLKTCLKKHKKAISIAREISKNSKEEFIIINGQADPHIWMDVKLFSLAIDPIVKQLSLLDPEHQEEFEKNGQELLAKMLATDYCIKKLMKNIPEEKKYLITTHDAFYYFSRAYLTEDHDFLDRVAAPEGLAPDGQMSLSDIKKIIHFSLEKNIDTLFSESNLSQDALKKVVKSLKRKHKNAKIAQDYLYGDSLGEKGSEADDYLKMMLYNAKVISKNLGQI